MRKSDIPCFGCEHGKDSPKVCRHTCERWAEYEKAQRQESIDNLKRWEYNDMMNSIESQRIETFKKRRSRKDGRKN